METLPNIDINIKVGDSLLAPVVNIGLFIEKRIIDEYKNLFKQYQETSDKQERDKIRKELEQMREEIAEKGRVLDEKYVYDNKLVWNIDFPHTIADNGQFKGFDVIIANPPYIGEKGHKEMFDKIKRGVLGKYYQGKMDLFYFFFHLALDIASRNGVISFITTNYYPTDTGAKKLRKDFKERAIVRQLINFNELEIFKGLGIHNMITILQKGHDENAIAYTCVTKRKGSIASEVFQAIVDGKDIETDYYKVTQKDLYDGEEYYMILTRNSNESGKSIQTILDKVKKQGVNLGIICNITCGIHAGAEKVSKSIAAYFNDLNYNIGDGIFVLNQKEALQFSGKPYLKPYFKSSDISKWTSITKSSQYILYSTPYNKISDNVFMTHISKYKPVLQHVREINNESLDNWLYLRRGIHNESVYINPKIVTPYRTNTLKFSYIEKPWYSSLDVYYIVDPEKGIDLRYILALLNSKLYYLWFYYRGKRKGEVLELYQKPLSEVPIKRIPVSEQQPFIHLVNQILGIKQSNPDADVSSLESQIDNLVYQLYVLEPDEIAIIENEINKIENSKKSE